LAASGNDLLTSEEIAQLVQTYQAEMQKAADDLEFERAAQCRDRVLLLKDMQLGLKPASRVLLAAPAPAKEEAPRPRRYAGRRRRR
jgi:excinuclease ABC subunit B